MTPRTQRFTAIIFGSLILAVLLLGFIPPCCGGGGIVLEMKAKSVMKQAYQIHQALFAYSQGSDGAFPSTKTDGTAVENSNEAFRELFVRGLVDDERLFYVQRSAWHAGKKVDGDMGDASNGFKNAVAKNENHWSYVSGLNSKTSPPETPLVLDGCSEIVGTWSDDESKKGGLWRGKFLIMVKVGGNAKVLDLTKDLPKKIADQINAVLGAKLLNPDS